jgi:hypothetical protein
VEIIDEGKRVFARRLLCGLCSVNRRLAGVRVPVGLFVLLFGTAPSSGRHFGYFYCDLLRFGDLVWLVWLMPMSVMNNAAARSEGSYTLQRPLSIQGFCGYLPSRTYCRMVRTDILHAMYAIKRICCAMYT